MKLKTTIKFLTQFLVLAIFCRELFAEVLTQESFPSHLRWNVFTKKDAVVINKNESQITIKSLNVGLLEEIQKNLKKVKLNKDYISHVELLPPDKSSNVSSIVAKLSRPSVEVFHFYGDRDSKYIIDFWEEKKSDEDSALKTVRKDYKKKSKDLKKVSKSRDNVRFLKKDKDVKSKRKRIFAKKSKKKKAPYKDFRYGATFIWDYAPMAPTPLKEVNIERKTPEFFYPIKDREFSKNEKEAHLQLAINLYRKKKWGLMYKSIKLFQNKYGEDTESDLVEYLKANALVRDNFAKGETDPLKMAMNMYSNLSLKTSNYDLQRALIKYLISYYHSIGDNVNALKSAKKLYVESKENFDYEETKVAAETILVNLAKLNQIEKLNEVLKDKTIVKLVPRHTMLSYKIYTLARLGDISRAIRIFNQNKKGLTNPVEKSIIYNIAESFFREASYKKAIKLYDEFLANYSFHSNASEARLRIALGYDILDRDPKKVSELYLSAINRSNPGLIRSEAKVRYVAFETIRKNKRTAKDLEKRVFLESLDDDISKSTDLKYLMWITRLRTYVVDNKFGQALSYLSALPLNTMKPSIRRVFEGDGAEVVYGLLKESFNKGKFARVVKIWESYKNKYVKKVANDPMLNFMVGKSFIKIGMKGLFNDLIEKFEAMNTEPERSFPMWIERDYSVENKTMVSELKVLHGLKNNELDSARESIADLEKENPNYSKVSFYKGLIAFKNKNYKNSVKEFENFLARGDVEKKLNLYEIAELMKSYTDSVYYLDDYSKFEQISDALIKDTNKLNKKNVYLDSVIERIRYLNIEIYSSKKKNYLLLEAKTKKFLEIYPKSAYLGRVEYLKGISLIYSDRGDEGERELSELLKREDIGEEIKELVKTELSLINIRKNTI